MAMNMFGTAGQIGPQNLQYSFGQGEASEGQGFNLGGQQFSYGIMNPGEEGSQYGWRTSGGLTGTDLNSLLAQLGLGSGHQGYGMGASSMGDGTESFNLQSTSPFYTPEVQSQFNARYAPGYGGGDWTQVGSANPQGLKNAGLLFNDPEYGYITPASNYEQRSMFQQLAPLAAVLAAPFAYSALAGLGGGAGAGAASVAPSGFAASPVGFQALPAATGIEGLAGSLGLGAAPASGISPALAALSAPGAGMITPGTIGLGGAGLGPTLGASAAGALPLPANSLGAALTLESMGIPNAAGAAGSGFGAPAAGALPAISAIAGGPAPFAGLNPELLAAAAAPPYTTPASIGIGSNIGPTLASAGYPSSSIFNSIGGLLSGLLGDPDELLKLLAATGMNAWQTGQAKNLAQDLYSKADPFAPHRPQYAQNLNALMRDPAAAVEANPFFQDARGMAEQAVMRKAAATGMLESGNVLDELYKTNAGIFNQFLNQERDMNARLAGAYQSPGAGAGLYGQAMGGYLGGLEDYERIAANVFEPLYRPQMMTVEDLFRYLR